MDIGRQPQGSTMQTLHWVTCRPQEKQPQEIVFLWADALASSGWEHWQPDIAAVGGNHWGDAVDQMAFPGFRQDDGEVSEGTSSATLQPMTDQQAS